MAIKQALKVSVSKNSRKSLTQVNSLCANEKCARNKNERD